VRRGRRKGKSWEEGKKRKQCVKSLLHQDFRRKIKGWSRGLWRQITEGKKNEVVKTIRIEDWVY